jgi:choline dehydrogenase
MPGSPTPGVEYMFMLCATLQRPKSAGTVRLASRDLNVQPEININLLAEEEDMEKMVDGVRRAWAILASPQIAALTDRIVMPTAEMVGDDDGVREYLRGMVSHLVHPVGTCKMGPQSDPLAVVAQDGAVHGMEALRVVDASIMPDLVRANTNLTAIMIGERIAEMMRR